MKFCFLVHRLSQGHSANKSDWSEIKANVPLSEHSRHLLEGRILTGTDFCAKSKLIGKIPAGLMSANIKKKTQQNSQHGEDHNSYANVRPPCTCFVSFFAIKLT